MIFVGSLFGLPTYFFCEVPMLSQPSILVIDDFTDYSLNALIFADDLRIKTKGLMTVATPIYTFVEDPIHDSDIEKKIKERLEKEHIIAKCEIIEGDFFKNLNNLIKTLEVDLLILGESMIHPFLGIKDFNANKIINKIDIPVLIIRKSGPVERVDVLVDPRYSMEKLINLGEEFSSLLSIDLGIVSIWKESELSEKFGSRMGYPYVSTDLSVDQRTAFLDKLKTIIKHRTTEFAQADVHVALPIYLKDVSEQLISIVSEDRANMIILQKHDHRTFENIFSRSPISQLIKKFEGNILVCPS